MCNDQGYMVRGLSRTSVWTIQNRRDVKNRWEGEWLIEDETCTKFLRTRSVWTIEGRSGRYESEGNLADIAMDQLLARNFSKMKEHIETVKSWTRNATMSWGDGISLGGEVYDSFDIPMEVPNGGELMYRERIAGIVTEALKGRVRSVQLISSPSQATRTVTYTEPTTSDQLTRDKQIADTFAIEDSITSACSRRDSTSEVTSLPPERWINLLVEVVSWE